MNFDQHLAALAACRLCPNVLGSPVTGAVADARVMLVGQAPGPREMEQHRPFAFTAGRRLFAWFERLGVSEQEFRERVHMCAVIRCFPGRDPKAGGDRVPSPEEIANCAAHLDREIALLAPGLVIAVGTLAAAQLCGVRRPRRRSTAPARPAHSTLSDVVVLPHPSGRSTWTNKPENAALLARSLELIGAHAAWRKTFSSRRPRA
ncbi:MAG TPA: uracil-DNA glycosylase family protein [Thermoanaerobaculia bacterium]|nr:uracil-DNA glycosylase family protein [Thermoanaerobaculia bacterium]